MFRVPNQYRVRNGPYASPDHYGTAGAFLVPHPTLRRLVLYCLVGDGYGWEHVSVSVREHKTCRCILRTPTWEEMCAIKELFWEEEDCVVQFHPARSAYCDDHPFVLHLWRPVGAHLPEPAPLMVGLGGKTG